MSALHVTRPANRRMNLPAGARLGPDRPAMPAEGYAER